MKKQIIVAADFKLLSESKLDAQGANPTMKKKSLAKLTELKESCDLCDIWRVRNLESRQITFNRQLSSGFIQQRLDYIFISVTLQELVTTTEILTPILTNHSPVIYSLSNENDYRRSKGFWKSSLTKDQNYITEIEKPIHSFCTTNESLYNRQLKWEFLKYEVPKLITNYKKPIAKEKRQQRLNLENQLKTLEKCLDKYDNLSKYNAVKNQLDAIYDHMTEGIPIRSKFKWYEHSEK